VRAFEPLDIRVKSNSGLRTQSVRLELVNHQMRAEAEVKPDARLHAFAILVACLTVALLIAGALVTSNEAGDSVPDWPLSFGRWLIAPENFRANVRFEYSHRFIAGLVGTATALLAVLSYFLERRSWVRRLTLIAFGGVVLQALIGGVRVHFPEYRALIAVPHALVAQSFFGLIVAIAVFTSRHWTARTKVQPDDGSPPLRKLTLWSICVVLIQLVLGAGFRHGAFGIIPHIVGAVAVTILLVTTAILVLARHSKDGFLARPARLSLVFLIMQLALGVAAYLTRLKSAGDVQPLEPMISLTAGHVVLGALTLATVLLLALRCHRALAPQGEALTRRAGAEAVGLG